MHSVSRSKQKKNKSLGVKKCRPRKQYFCSTRKKPNLVQFIDNQVGFHGDFLKYKYLAKRLVTRASISYN